ncbi:MAG TPA: hypothetical protein P5120_05095 [Spirochaetota bacterium]|nr:hypothetical protein [Spirochaetota bacterium]HPF06264.1 hypothetical protein [Spirochaetota bacterium]HPJ43382.1 hypothetical protein [Spirochaetota bacterium]HPR38199.1 hypothetical protein [Spirochaetota bacterium]HRX46874.1 hypothetical protein [Spirochaetota bacterium]
MKRIFALTLLMLILSSSAFSIALDDLQIKPVTADRVKYFPVPDDNKNYMFLQAIDNDSYIVIGDFSGVDKVIVLIIDKGNDNTVDAVVEYFPLNKNYRMKKSSDSKFFTTDLAKLKKQIITGSIYKNNYTDEMKSSDALEAMLKRDDKIAVFEDVYGFNIKLFEIDETNKYSAKFAYGKNAGGYYLQFRTEYYRRNFGTEIKPVLKYSVYCKDTNDPVVKEYVESLFKIRAPKVLSAK